MTKKNVLHLVEYLYLGGIERLLEQFAINSTSKINNHFFTYETSELNGIGKNISELGFPVEIYKKSPGTDFNLVKKLASYIDLHNIEIIHTHDFGPVEYAIILKMIKPKIKLIHTQHTIIHFIRHKKYTLFFSFAMTFYKKIICVSDFVKEQILSNCIVLNKKKLAVISNGVNLDKFSNLNNDIDLECLKFVSIARISYEKNLNYLLNTFKLLKSENINFEFHHAGTSKNKSEMDQINKFIEENNLTQNVYLYGYIDDVEKILEKGDFFISSSITEGHPVAVLEAMAAEKVCICSDIKAHLELGSDSINFFELNDSFALFKIIKEIFKNPELISNFDKRKSAKQKVLEKFSIKNMTENYLYEYKK